MNIRIFDVYLMCVLSDGSCVVFGAHTRQGQPFADLKVTAARTVTLLAELLKSNE